MITVIGAGSGRAENLTLAAWETLKNAPRILLQTEQMPLSAFLRDRNVPFETLDALYREAEDFDKLNQKVKDAVEAMGEGCYVVHGSALDDTSVMALDPGLITILPGVSVADAAAAALKRPGASQRMTSTEVLAGIRPSPRRDAVITCVDSRLIAGDLKCLLADLYGDEAEVLLYHEDFSGNASELTLPLYELDMQRDYNRATSVFLPGRPLTELNKYGIEELREIMAILYSRDGCPWDSVQTHESLRPYLIEEAYEVADTIDQNDPYRLYDELGDVLFQVVFHAEIGKAMGDFDFTDVTDAICRKMIRRHPALFANAQPPENINDDWEAMKKQEKGLRSTADVMHDVPEGLPALAYAEKILHKASKGGTAPMPEEDVTKRLTALLASRPSDEQSLGDLLLLCVRLCACSGVHPELALHGCVRAYIRSFEEKDKI